MDLIWPLLFSLSMCFAFPLLLLLRAQRRTGVLSSRLPPGPRGWPVIGNVLDLGSMPHKTLATFTKRYGPVVWLKLGAVNTMVVLSAEAAMEMFKNHDVSFAGRTVNEAMKSCNFPEGSMALSQYGPYWRMLRRLCTTELFSNKCINETAILRRKCVDSMIRWISDAAQEMGSVDVGRFVFLQSFNMLSNLLLSRDILEPQSIEGEFFKLTSILVVLAGLPNLSDFFPLLQPIDPQGIGKKMSKNLARILDIISGFVKERIQDKSSSHQENKKRDFLDMLLEFEGTGKSEPAKISEKDICILIVELFIAGSETTGSTTEWAMTELLRNPASMRKVKTELTQVVGRTRKVEESDIENLPYLQAIVKETFRLHPPVPFLLPRRAVSDIEFMGYLIPKNAQILVNAWAIGRDPETWDDPMTFKPERFLCSDIDIDYRGHHFQLLPFGAGRRMCPGLPLGDRVTQLVLGSLLHSFDWVLEDGVTPETMDMGEKLGTVLRKAVPLKAVPKPLIV